jgi:hypothetical protein
MHVFHKAVITLSHRVLVFNIVANSNYFLLYDSLYFNRCEVLSHTFNISLNIYTSIFSYAYQELMYFFLEKCLFKSFAYISVRLVLLVVEVY